MDELQEKSIDQLWRGLFVGEAHIILSNVVASSFNEILKIAEKFSLLNPSPYSSSKIQQTNVDDLSDTTKLINIRFESAFANRAGYTFKAELPNLMQTFSYSNHEEWIDIAALNEIRQGVYKGIQFQAICKQLNFSRNLNAHSNKEANDVGHAVLVAGAILRLSELFELGSNKTGFEKLKVICVSIFECAYPALGAAITINPSVDGLEKLSAGEIEDEDEGESTETINLPIEYLPDRKNEELIRQQLLILRQKILTFLKTNYPEVKRDKCIISNQIIEEIISSDISEVSHMKLLPSMKYLLKTNEKVVLDQLDNFGDSIVSVLVSKNV